MTQQLYDLSLGALAKFMYNVTIQLGELTKNGKLDLHTIQQISRYMQNMLSVTPRLIADEVTFTLQNCVLSAVSIITDFHDCLRNCECLMDDIFVNMWNATVVPSTTSLVLTRENLPYVKGECNIRWKIHFLIKNVLAKVRSISVLKCNTFEACNIFKNSSRFENLVELTFEDTFMTLDKVTEKCRKLKKLEIRGCLCDDSVKTLVKLQHLEYLDIRNSIVSDNYLSFIVQNLPHLKVFKSQLSSSHVLLLGKHNPNLSSLEVVTKYKFNSMPVVFKNLVSLSINSYYAFNHGFDIMVPALLAIGPRFQELRLLDICDIDLDFISTKCPSLKVLGLSFTNNRMSGVPYLINWEDSRSPDFSSIVSCELNMTYDYLQHILSYFVNLKTVVIDRCCRPITSLFGYIADRMIEGSIEELYVRKNKLQLSGSQLLIHKCNGSICVKQMTEFESVIDDIFSMKLEYKNFL